MKGPRFVPTRLRAHSRALSGALAGVLSGAFLWALLLSAAGSPAAAQPPDPPEPPAVEAEAPQEPDENGEKLGKRKRKKADKRRLQELEEQLPEKYQQWLAEVDLLISDEERARFLEIEKDYQRDAFIESFWRERDTFPDTARNEFRERWDRRVEEARFRYGDLLEDRSRILLLNGNPDAMIEIRCSDLVPGEVWYYGRAPTLGREVALLFYQRGSLGPFRLWNPQDGLQSLLRFGGMRSSAEVFQALDTCRPDQADAMRLVLRTASLEGVMGYSIMVRRLLEPPEPATGEWVATFHAYSTELESGAETFEATLTVRYPARNQHRTVMQGVISVPVAEAEMIELAGHGSYNFSLTGEILLGEKLFENFRYRFNFPESEIQGDEIPLVFERYLRPGEYKLIVRVEDANSERQCRIQEPLNVPQLSFEPPPPPDEETARLLAEANAAITSGMNTVQLVEPRGELQSGLMRVDTLTTGQAIDHVSFTLDGREILTKRRPPWTVELDLGTLPRMRTLTAIAYDADRRELARDELQLNTGANRFAVRLVEPRRDKRYEKSLRAEAEVQVPEGSVVERVEFYFNERLAATLYQPPFSQAILLPEEIGLAYVRAVAYQPDGNATEDTVFINAPDYLESLEIQFIELYIAALDRTLRPVDGLTLEDFRVLEDGQPQEPVRFDRVENLPIHAGIMLDVSASMIDSLETARDAALRFFQQAVQPRDRALLITFNDHPFLAVRFTNDLGDLAGGLAGLKAERGTALYDSLVFALYYFNGVKGQRALILLSDGKDEHSRFTFEDTLEYARRAGVVIYTIGLDLKRADREVKRKLERLAEETGGRRFLVEGAEALPGIYDEIQRELRSRYYLAYQSTNTSLDDTFRTIDVEIDRPGVEAKTLRGYYP